ncbi:MAG: cytochrome c [Verrucomicrobiota bacterium]
MNHRRKRGTVVFVTLALTWVGERSWADPEVMELGKRKYLICGACHGADGKGISPGPGMAMAPNLLESDLLMRSEAELIAAILFRGIQKEDPADFMGQAMTALGINQKDEDLAAVITYVRSAFAGHDDVVTPEQVSEWRIKYATGEGMYSREDLEGMMLPKAKE